LEVIVDFVELWPLVVVLDKLVAGVFRVLRVLGLCAEEAVHGVVRGLG